MIIMALLHYPLWVAILLMQHKVHAKLQGVTCLATLALVTSYVSVMFNYYAIATIRDLSEANVLN